MFPQCTQAREHGKPTKDSRSEECTWPVLDTDRVPANHCGVTTFGGDCDNEGAHELQIRLFGRFRVFVGEWPVPDDRWERPKARELVRLLAVAPDQALQREQILDALWPNLDPRAGLRQLSKALHQARRALEPELAPRAPSSFLYARGDVVELRAGGSLWIDAVEFDRLGRAGLRDRDAESCRRALLLAGDELLPADRYAEWAIEPRRRMEALRAELISAVATTDVNLGRYDEAVESIRDLLRLDEANEEAHRLLMQCFAGLGKRDRALRQYELCRETLRRELGVEPDSVTRKLRARIVEDVKRDELQRGGTPDAAPQRSTNARTLSRLEPDSLTRSSAPAPGRDASRLSSREFGRSGRVRIVAASIALLVFWLVLPVDRMWHRVGLAVAKAQARLSADGGRLVSIRGVVAVPGTRVEAVNSVSGWAGMAGRDGEFLIADVLWYPGAAVQLVVSMPSGAVRTFRTRMPQHYPANGVVDVDSIDDSLSERDFGNGVLGLNGTSTMTFDFENAEYYRGVFEAVTSGSTTARERLSALCAFVALRFDPTMPQRSSLSPRRSIERGTGSSGDLAIAMATVARVGGYDARLVNLVDTPDGIGIHMIVEVACDGRWQAFDPTYGIVFQSETGTPAEFADLRLGRAQRVTVGPATAVPDWYSGACASGIHHFYQFREE